MTHPDLCPKCGRPVDSHAYDCPDYVDPDAPTEAEWQAKEAHYRHLNARLREPDEATAEAYVALRNRTALLVKLLLLNDLQGNVPATVLNRQKNMVAETLDSIDSQWRES
jgi:hypothetical protein